MSTIKISLVYGWCRNSRVMVAYQIEEILTQAVFQYKTSHQSVWDNPEPPHSFDLVLQRMLAFTETDTGCPVITIKPMLADINHQPMLEKITRHMESNYAV